MIRILAAIFLMVFIVVSFTFIINAGIEKDARRQERLRSERKEWISRGHCRVEERQYATIRSVAQTAYRCDDGILYWIEDL